MSSLLDLPRELRDFIWAEVFSKDNYSHPKLAYELLRTNKQVQQDVAPYLYDTVVFHLQRPHQALHWIYRIGTFNASCIRRLVLSFSSIELNIPRDNAADIWSSCLGLLTNLEYLTYEYDPKQNKYDSTNPIDHHPAISSQIDEALSLNPKLRRGASKYDHGDGILSSFSKLRERIITHAILGIDDIIPEVCVSPFKMMLLTNSDLPLEQN
ncbi:MAG: hypothetical protein Q9183_004361, partial [Haloplaca sp. 2 TL-2023]